MQTTLSRFSAAFVNAIVSMAAMQIRKIRFITPLELMGAVGSEQELKLEPHRVILADASALVIVVL